MPLNAKRGVGLAAGRPAIFTMAAIAVALLVQSTPVAAQSVQRGMTLAGTYCVKCHSIDKVSPSPLTIAPPFRELHKRYPVEQLEEALAEGLVTGHPTMPEFRFDVGQVRDLIAFLKTL